MSTTEVHKFFIIDFSQDKYVRLRVSQIEAIECGFETDETDGPRFRVRMASGAVYPLDSYHCGELSDLLDDEEILTRLQIQEDEARRKAAGLDWRRIDPDQEYADGTLQHQWALDQEEEDQERWAAEARAEALRGKPRGNV